MSEYKNFLIHHNLEPPAKNQKNQFKRIKRLDKRLIPDDAKEIRLFCYCRDGFERLPFFLEYYRKLGVNRFFFLDNASVDGTAIYLLKQPDVHLFFSEDSFSESKGGLFWIESLVGKYGMGYWCLVVDIDEFFCFDQSEVKTLQNLRDFLAAEKSEAFQVMLLDMYAKQSIRLASYHAGQNPLEVCPYYDVDTHDAGSFLMDGSSAQVHRRFVGGVRKRIFNFEPCLTKFPFFKFTSGVRLHRGCHRIWGVKISKLKGVTMHFKFFSSFLEQIKRAVEEKNYWQESREYFLYHEKLHINSGISFYDEKKSRKVENTKSLVDAGLLDEIPLAISKERQLVNSDRSHCVNLFESKSFLKKIAAKFQQHWFCLSAICMIDDEKQQANELFAEKKYFLNHVDTKLSQTSFFKKGRTLILTCDLSLFSSLCAQHSFSPPIKSEAEIIESWLAAHLSFFEATSFLPSEKVSYVRLEDLNELSAENEKKLLPWLPSPLLEGLKKRTMHCDKRIGEDEKDQLCMHTWMSNYPEIKQLRKIFGYLDQELTPELMWIK